MKTRHLAAPSIALRVIAQRLIAQRLIALAIISLLLPVIRHGHANPSTTAPHTPLQAHNTIDGAARQINAMYAKYDEWETLVIEATALLQSGKNFPHQELATIYPETYRGVWYAEHLKVMGEPAGYDLHRKFSMLRKAMGVFASVLQEHQPQKIASLSQGKSQRQQAIADLQQLANQGSLADAEKQLQEIYLRMLSDIFYLSASQARPFENEIAGPYAMVRSKRNEQRRATYRERAKSAIANHSQAIDRISTESTRIANELSSSSTATLESGQQGDPADALAYVGRLWGNASAAITRSTAVAWAFETRSTEATAKAFRAPLNRANSAAVQGIVSILNASERSVPAQELPKLVPRILHSLSIIQRRQTSSLDESIQQALQQLLEKSTSLSERSRRYTAATKEPMRWMRRFTAQRVERLKRIYPATSSVLNQSSTPSVTIQPSIYRPAPARKRILTPGSLVRPASWLAGDATPVISRKVRDAGNVRATIDENITFVPQDPRHYTTLPADFPVDGYKEELNSWLLVDPEHPPLNLDATEAISSAQLQEFQQVGGTITALTLEPFLPRFATLPDKAHAIVPLDRLPMIDVRGEPAEKVIWRVDIKPEWIAHRLFLAAPKEIFSE